MSGRGIGKACCRSTHPVGGAIRVETRWKQRNCPGQRVSELHFLALNEKRNLAMKVEGLRIPQ